MRAVWHQARCIARPPRPPRPRTLKPYGLRWFSLDPRYDIPLRILFCGTDEFSATSLKTLHNYREISDGHIASIDVATKTDKRVGRGLKQIASPPIKTLARELDLPLHQFDTFTSWSPPANSSINLVIAVSFGLKVPPRILRACEFGGLNVHPSLLPDLKGASPIESAIIHGYKQTGVTVQTLHLTKFDEGQVLAQTSRMTIPQPDYITAKQLRGLLAPVGANLLVQTLDQRLYLEPPKSTIDLKLSYMHTAPKLSPETRHVDFANMSASHICRLHRAVPKLWFMARQGEDNTTSLRVVLEEGVRQAQDFDLAGLDESLLASVRIGIPFAFVPVRQNLSESKASLLVKTAEGSILSVSELTVAGKRKAPSVAALAQAQLFSKVVEVGTVKLCELRPPVMSI
ncbi:hypothetical protein BT93_L5224 [Corymbia citriodora subsp. variegata]|uniref:methionyl-tRNA formyltransferase n=1 Tax=Corymbia citriodora subsp. variegata TaxID=360336 RepID=A0A8T0CFC3_CORYI|nr:hypothetical protein BT93_L5224 [Corymbia citriodora subsp. variegata]